MQRLLALLLCLGGLVAAGEQGAPDRARRAAVAAGLRYLAKQQMRDGSFGGRVVGTIGVSSLSLLAFLAQGHQEGRGPYGGVIRRGVDYLLKHSLPPGSSKRPGLSYYGKPTGYIHVRGDSDSRMHGHGYATQVLVLVHGSGRSATPRARDLRRKIRRALSIIEQSQTLTGGWGYEPNDDSFHEGSVTVTLVQALRLARDGGFVVDAEVVRRGLRYLRNSQKGDGSFKYSLLEPRSSPALTAAAITAMQGLGEHHGPAIRRGLQYLEEAYRDRSGHAWPFYANYYAAQAFYQAGGRGWRLWNSRVLPGIVDAQRNGSWDDRDFAHAAGAQGRTYATAMSCLALSVADGYLPLFQK